jgi:Tol biopolymer transport system component
MDTIIYNSKKIATVLTLGFGSLTALSQDIVVPGAKPGAFTHEAMSAINNESVLTFMPDGRKAFIADGQTIVYSSQVNGKWTKTNTAPFSGHWKDWDPALKPDGSRLVFVSNRPLESMPQDSAQKDNHLWYVDLLPGGVWSAPRHFDAPVNIPGFNDYGPSLSGAGSVCFCSRNRDGNKGMGGYYVKWLGDHYAKPELLSLNGASEIYDPFIAPDESYIIFVSNGDLYISYRQTNGWSQGTKLAAVVNNGNGNSDPYVSPDGKMLYYNQDKTPGILMIMIRIPGMKS